MNREEKEIRQKETLEKIIAKADVLRLGLCRDNLPYIVPVSFGYEDNCFFFHSASEGMKIDYIGTNNKVCFELECDVYMLPNDKSACSWSVSYYSIIGFGIVEEIIDPQKRLSALNQIMNHYSPERKQWEYSSHMLEKTKLWQIKIESMTGKKSKDKIPAKL